MSSPTPCAGSWGSATTPLDVDALLDLARDAAHGVERTAAPLTTYLVGRLAGLAGGTARLPRKRRAGPRRSPGAGRDAVRAVVVPEPGGPDALQWQEVPDPVAGAGQVVVEVVAAGINRADLLQREGHYPPPPGAPPYPGLECSGRIASVATGVEGWSIGDEVARCLLAVAMPSRSSYRPDSCCRAEGIDLVTAAALPEACLHGVVQHLHAGPADAGDWLLVHGGASGIGTVGDSAGHELGAMVAVTAGSAAKLDRCAELGADVLVNYQEQDFVEEVRGVTGGRGADVVLDIIGAKYLDPEPRRPRDRGTPGRRRAPGRYQGEEPTWAR